MYVGVHICDITDNYKGSKIKGPAHDMEDVNLHMNKMAELAVKANTVLAGMGTEVCSRPCYPAFEALLCI